MVEVVVIGTRGRDLIRAHEGLRISAYLDPVGIPTIGYGSTRGVKLGDTITPEEAEARLERDLSDAEAALDALVRVPLTEAMRDALASWTFNLGAKKLRISTLLRRLNAREYERIPAEIRRWTFGRVNGEAVELPGLVTRRAEEAALFLADGIPGGESDGSAAA